jgi:hypothetical protein
MNQREIYVVLSEKLNSGSITRRQFAQAAAFFGIGAAVLPGAASAAPGGQAKPSIARHQAEGEVRFLIAEAFWADWHQYLSTAQSQWRLGRQIFDTLVMLETADVSVFSPGLAEAGHKSTTPPGSSCSARASAFMTASRLPPRM